jgi:putative transposase
LEGQVRWFGSIGSQRLRGLENENARLKKLLADAMLDNAALKDLLAKKW